MELKYYLRGLGLGIAITAVIMAVITSKNRTMTNEEIIARAKELGMTQDTVLTEINSEKKDTDKEDTEKVSQSVDESEASGGETGQKDGDLETESDNMVSSTGEPGQEGVFDDDGIDGSEDDTEATDSGRNSVTDVIETEAKTTDVGTDAQPGEINPEAPMEASTEASAQTQAVQDSPLVITIRSGDGSYSVSKKLEDVGAVVSASDFDTFLCQNGYDKRIRTGTYTIPYDASDEQMARIITGLN